MFTTIEELEHGYAEPRQFLLHVGAGPSFLFPFGSAELPALIGAVGFRR